MSKSTNSIDYCINHLSVNGIITDLPRPQYNNKLTKALPKLHELEFEGCSMCKDIIAENKELKEIVQKNIMFLSAETLNNGIKISKNKAKEIENINKRCKDFIYLTFDIEGNIIEIKADIEIDKDTSENFIQTNTKDLNNDDI